jgi:hypothetical protein
MHGVHGLKEVPFKTFAITDDEATTLVTLANKVFGGGCREEVDLGSHAVGFSVEAAEFERVRVDVTGHHWHIRKAQCETDRVVAFGTADIDDSFVSAAKEAFEYGMELLLVGAEELGEESAASGFEASITKSSERARLNLRSSRERVGDLLDADLVAPPSQAFG